MFELHRVQDSLGNRQSNNFNNHLRCQSITDYQIFYQLEIMKFIVGSQFSIAQLLDQLYVQLCRRMAMRAGGFTMKSTLTSRFTSQDVYLQLTHNVLQIRITRYQSLIKIRQSSYQNGTCQLLSQVVFKKSDLNFTNLNRWGL